MTRTTWENASSTATPLSAAYLNSLEERKPEVDELWVNLKTLGWQGTGDSVDAYVAEALTILGADGGTIFFPSGDGTFSALPSFESTRGVILRGSGGVNSGAGPPTRLTYTGTGARGIDARSTQGFQIRDIQVTYTNAGFTGILLDLSRGSGFDTLYGILDRCFLGGDAVDGAAALVAYNDAICQTARDCVFGRGAVAIKGVNTGSDYSNIINVDNCAFVGQTTTSVINANQTWTFRGCTFEPLQSGAAGAFSQVVGSSKGLTFLGCWFGDANTTGTQIAITGSGTVIGGCYISSGLKGVSLSASSTGASIKGNMFQTMTTGVDIAANCKWADVTANEFSGVTNAVVTADNASGSFIQSGNVIEHRGTPSVRVYSSGHPDIVNNTATVILWDSEHWDSTGTMHDTGSNTGRLVAPIAGIYMVTAAIPWNTGTTGLREVKIRSNGTVSEANETIDASGSSPQQVVTMPIKLAAAGYVEVLVTHTQGVNLLVVGTSTGASLSMTYMGTV